MGDIMESGYYIQKGLNDGQELFYLNVLVTVKAFSKKDLENRVNEVIKMMTAKQIIPAKQIRNSTAENTRRLAVIMMPSR